MGQVNVRGSIDAVNMLPYPSETVGGQLHESPEDQREAAGGISY